MHQINDRGRVWVCHALRESNGLFFLPHWKSATLNTALADKGGKSNTEWNGWKIQSLACHHKIIFSVFQWMLTGKYLLWPAGANCSSTTTTTVVMILTSASNCYARLFLLSVVLNIAGTQELPQSSRFPPAVPRRQRLLTGILTVCWAARVRIGWVVTTMLIAKLLLSLLSSALLVCL